VAQNADQEFEGVLDRGLDEMDFQRPAKLSVLINVSLILDGGESFLQILVIFDDVKLDQGVGGEIPEPVGLLVGDVHIELETVKIVLSGLEVGEQALFNDLLDLLLGVGFAFEIWVLEELVNRESVRWIVLEHLGD